MTEKEAFLILNNLPKLGAVTIRTFLDVFKTAKKVLNASYEQLVEVPGVRKESCQSIAHWKEYASLWEKDLAFVNRYGIHLVSCLCKEYPALLRKYSSAPPLLYVKGEVSALSASGFTVVGTRSPTIYGRELAEKLGRGLAERKLLTLSGLARGIDTSAHWGSCRAGGVTVGILGSGLAKMYPSENQLLAEKISEQGAVVSEFPMLTSPDKQRFPQRNRTLSALSLGVVLIEAPQKSGAMHTMHFGEDQGKPLFAFPGRVDIPTFLGNHWWIKRGKAQLIEGIEDLLKGYEDLSLLSFSSEERNHRCLPELGGEERALLQMMPSIECHWEELLEKTAWPTAKLLSTLTSLLLKRAIQEYPGKIYKKKCML